ncbi:hypothetical protein Angca_004166 [Angiostrongylus cantonensis]|nr:hypothetical protein Angca_004166 [Angiostrongylus cantonensis]
MAELSHIANQYLEVYEALFREANPANLPAIAAVDAAAFLRRSNLSMQQLGQIWELADYQKKGVLDKNGFFIAFKLVAAAQQGLPISPASISINTLKPPHFDGISDKSAVSMSNPPCHDGFSPTGWCISAADQVKYDSIFDSLCPVDDKLPGVRVKPVLLNSGLNPAILAKIWELADQDKDGQLDRIEMAVAMHLVYRALQGDPVPAVLPHSLIHPSKVTLTRPASTSSVNTGNAHPNIPMPPQARYSFDQSGHRSRAGSMTSLDSIGRPHVVSHLENRSASVQPSHVLRNESVPATPVRGMGAPLSTSSNTSLEWPVDRLSSAGQFAACDTDSDGYVNGNDVKHVLLGSGLPQTELAQIWALCDINRTGKLNQEQFALINHLVTMRKRGEELPLTLPPFLIPPSLRVVSVPESGEGVVDTNSTNANISGSDSGEIRRLAQEMEKLLSDRREADIQVSQLEADMKVKDSQIKNLQVELHTLQLTVKQLERQKMEANRRLADLDDQIKQLELASVAQARKAEEAQTRLNQLVEDTQKDEACAEADQLEISQLRAELAQLEAQHLNLTSELTHEKNGMEAAVDKITELERKKHRDEAQRVQLQDAIAQANTIVSDLQAVLKSDDSLVSLSSKMHFLENISRNDLVHFSLDPFAQTDPFAASAAPGAFAVQFTQDPFGATASLGDASANAVSSPDGNQPPPRPAPPKSSARQTPVYGDPFTNTDPFASDPTTTTGGFADFSSFSAFTS